MRFLIKLGVSAALLLGLPLLGVHLAGKPLARYLEFPPQTHYIEHEPFSWPIFLTMAAFVIIALLPFVWRACRTPSRRPARVLHAFPIFGWIGLAIVAISWILAWNRFPWFAPFQAHT